MKMFTKQMILRLEKFDHPTSPEKAKERVCGSPLQNASDHDSARVMEIAVNNLSTFY